MGRTRMGRTDRRTDGRTDGQGDDYMLPRNFLGSIINAKCTFNNSSTKQSEQNCRNIKIAHVHTRSCTEFEEHAFKTHNIVISVY